MTKKILALSSLAMLAMTSLAHAGVSIFEKIADGSYMSVGNGSVNIKKYDTSLTKPELVKKALAELSKERWDNCGPWKTIDTRRTAIRAIEKLEADQDAHMTAQILEDLYEQGKIVAIVGNISNTEIECSLSWFNVYGTDGTVLKLRYEMGD